ncbi:hypothetical protein [Rhodoferax sp.]|uniref:hypothetical protein n=1 Tax=Rhodoferax sp. TaxID=50421 RepID=UPI002634DF7E|nr:hypothetical protein [Rhodoferax sp.]MDD2919729.1 hypothetical protein [Rhodoferax sp.]
MNISTRLPKKYANEQVLVVQYASLSELLPTVGVWPVRDKLLDLVAKPGIMRRDQAEMTTAVTQLVAYYIVVNESRLLTHRRTRRQPEKRLTAVRAIGLSGHMTTSDLQTLLTRDLFHAGEHTGYANRELAEEVAVRVSSKHPITLRGFIWEPIDDFGKQHLGLIYIVPAEAEFRVLEPGLIGEAQFSTLPEISRSVDAYTSWSRLLLQSNLLTEALTVEG